MSISASAVAQLRKVTGVSMMQCKSALEEAGGDQEKAVEILRKKGIASAEKKSDREQGEGAVFAAEGDGKAAVVTINCETDFVARDDNFIAAGGDLAETLASEGEDALKAKAETVLPGLVQKLGENITLGQYKVVEAATTGTYVHSNSKIGVVVGLSGGDSEVARDVAMHAAAMNPQVISPDDVPAEEVEKEKSIWQEQLAKEGKPQEIMDKIFIGKEKKFREENALISQPFVKDPEKTVESVLSGATVEGYVRFEI